MNRTLILAPSYSEAAWCARLFELSRKDATLVTFQEAEFSLRGRVWNQIYLYGIEHVYGEMLHTLKLRLAFTVLTTALTLDRGPKLWAVDRWGKKYSYSHILFPDDIYLEEDYF